MDPLKLIRFVKHGAVCLEYEDVVVYIDPYQLDRAEHDADLIVITHAHDDHFSPEDIEKVRKEGTCFATTVEVAIQLEHRLGIQDEYISHLSFEAPSLCYECGVILTPVEAENGNHPLGFGFGVMVELGGFKYYFSGDTDRLAQDIGCDVLFVACDGIYNMQDYLRQVPREIEAMDEKPGLIVPYHYGSFEGTGGNGKKLAQVLRAQGYKVKLLIK